MRQVKGENNDVMVKRLPKKPAPKRFGRKLTAAQKELATHICVDCGWIYAQRYVHVAVCCIAFVWQRRGVQTSVALTQRPPVYDALCLR